MATSSLRRIVRGDLGEVPGQALEERGLLGFSARDEGT